MDVIKLLYKEVENDEERKDFICRTICDSGSKLVEKASTHPHLAISEMLLTSFKLCVLFFQHIEKLKGPLDYTKIDMDEFCLKIQNDLYGRKITMKTREQATEYMQTLISHFNL